MPMSSRFSFLAEIKRRNVLRAAIPHFAVRRAASRGQSQLKRADMPLQAESEALGIDQIRAANPAGTSSGRAGAQPWNG